MESNVLQEYANSNSGYIIAPAGCGKTEFIIKALKLCDGKQLVLTHTNAGVRSLRERAIKRNLESKSYSINTIAGYCLMLCNSYPNLSGKSFEGDPITNEQWNEIYKGALKILNLPIGKKIIINSYSGLFIDEYQDCLKIHHEIIKNIQKWIPTRIAGDPLQGIFDFGDNKIIDWATDVEQNFTKISELTKPWRWLADGTNPKLGKWILEVRNKILSKESISLNNLPPGVKSIKPITSGYYSEAIKPWDESTIFIVKWPNQAINRAKGYGGVFNAMEEKELNELKNICSYLGSKSEYELCLGIFEVCGKCMSNINSEYKTIIKRIENHQEDLSYRLSKHRELANDFMTLISVKSYQVIENIIDKIGNNTSCNIYRKELFNYLKKTLKEYNTGNYEDLTLALREVRNRLRFYGRRIYNRSITRVLLIKGLEFDHTIVDLTQEFTIKELYVAISRPQKSLTLITNQDKLNF